MIKKFFLAGALLLSVVLILQITENKSFSYSPGSPGGYSSSPGDGNKTCAYCGAHGSSSTVTGWLSTNIPGTGYVAGTLYQISCTVTGTGEKGFEVTCENTSNVKKGTWTAGAGSKLVNSSHAVTQTSAPTTNPKTWTFGWTAPAAGTGTVKFYGCYDFGGNTRHENITIIENTTSVQENLIDQLSVFPNPASDHFEVNYTLTESTPVTATLFDVTGKKSFLLLNETETAGFHKHHFSLNTYCKGIYFLIIQTSKGETYQKLIIN